MQQTFDTLLYRTTNLQNRAESIRQFIARFKRTNMNYLKTKTTGVLILAQHFFNRFMNQITNKTAEEIDEDAEE